MGLQIQHHNSSLAFQNLGQQIALVLLEYITSANEHSVCHCLEQLKHTQTLSLTMFNSVALA